MWSPWLPFEWIVAIRFLKEGKIQTAFILIGISIGVAVIIFMSALLTGLQSNFVNRVLTGQAHIQLTAHKEFVRLLQTNQLGVTESANVQAPFQRFRSMDQWQNLSIQVGHMPEVKVVSPAVSGSALLTRGDASRSVTVFGMVPTLYFQIVPLAEKIVLGKSTLSGDEIFIGTELASDLGVGVGDKLRMSNATGLANTLTVAAIFDLGNKGANSRSTYVALRTAQSFFGITGGVSLLDLTVYDVYAAEKIARSIESMTGLQADSWIKTNEQFFTAVRAQSTANSAIRFFVALSVGFGIASVLVVSVVQRSREIGILRAMGIKRAQVLRIFLLQGGLLGLGGALLGAGIGGLALFLWQRLMRNADGSIMFPMVLDTELLVQTLVLATITGFISAFAPALRAASLDPVVAIRG